MSEWPSPLSIKYLASTRTWKSRYFHCWQTKFHFETFLYRILPVSYSGAAGFHYATCYTTRKSAMREVWKKVISGILIGTFNGVPQNTTLIAYEHNDGHIGETCAHPHQIATLHDGFKYCPHTHSSGLNFSHGWNVHPVQKPVIVTTSVTNKSCNIHTTHTYTQTHWQLKEKVTINKY